MIGDRLLHQVVSCHIDVLPVPAVVEEKAASQQTGGVRKIDLEPKDAIRSAGEIPKLLEVLRNTLNAILTNCVNDGDGPGAFRGLSILQWKTCVGGIQKFRRLPGQPRVLK